MRERVVWMVLAIAACVGVGNPSEGSDEPEKPLVLRAGTPPVLLGVVNARGGQVVSGDVARSRTSERGTGGVIVFDNFENEGSTSGYNVSYQNLGSYDGSDSSYLAFVLPMAEGVRSRAPISTETGYLIPTDIVWNEYEAEASRWPGGANGGPTRLTSISLVPSNYNYDPPVGGNNPVARIDTLRVRFFSSDRQLEIGGIDLVYNTPPGYGAYFAETVDVSMMVPAIVVPRTGYVMLDWAEPNISGVGTMFAGGDFVAAGYPSPDSLRLVGFSETLEMWWADGLIGASGWPERVDASYDGVPGTTSYVDIFNTGLLANWNFGTGEPMPRQLCRDFPCRLRIEGESACACDVDGSGAVNSQDFFDFITAFFSGDADFNESGFTDSQDFFDFLLCFFAGC